MTIETDELVWVEDRAWSLCDPEGRIQNCRRMKCHRRAVAILMRFSYSRNKAYPWAYCKPHMEEYGHRLNEGRIEVRVSSGTEAAERGWL